MTTWKDGGDCGRTYRAIVNEDENHVIAKVRTKREMQGIWSTIKSWPEGEANFRLILQAPRMLEALETVWDTRQSASYEERTEAGVTGYAFYLTESQCAQIGAVLAAVKGEGSDKSRGA